MICNSYCAQVLFNDVGRRYFGKLVRIPGLGGLWVALGRSLIDPGYSVLYWISALSGLSRMTQLYVRFQVPAVLPCQYGSYLRVCQHTDKGTCYTISLSVDYSMALVLRPALPTLCPKRTQICLLWLFQLQNLTFTFLPSPLLWILRNIIALLNATTTKTRRIENVLLFYVSDVFVYGYS